MMVVPSPKSEGAGMLLVIERVRVAEVRALGEGVDAEVVFVEKRTPEEGERVCIYTSREKGGKAMLFPVVGAEWPIDRKSVV